MGELKLGLQLGYWGSGPPPNAPELVARGRAPRVRLGVDGRGLRVRRPHPAGVVGVGAPTGSASAPPCASCRPARPPPWPWRRSPSTICAAGASSSASACRDPRSSKGWYGQSFPKPLARTREYVSIVRQVLAREAPVTNAGPHYPLPYPGRRRGSASRSRPSSTRCATTSPSSSGPRARRTWPWRPRSPTAGSRSSSPPTTWASSTSALDEGFARPGARRSAEDFEVIAFCPWSWTTTSSAAADLYRPMLALYIGGMGAKEMNFHFDVFVRMGFEAEAHKIQELYLDGHKDEAAAAVPTAMVEKIALIGPRAEDPRRARRLAGVHRHHPARGRQPPTPCA